MTWHTGTHTPRRDYRATARTRAPEDDSDAEHYGGDEPTDLDELVDRIERERDSQ